jgi:hypothetical protein
MVSLDTGLVMRAGACRHRSQHLGRVDYDQTGWVQPAIVLPWSAHQAKVHETDGLSVIDASMMPSVPSGFTHMSTIMVAGRLAETVAASL